MTFQAHLDTIVSAREVQERVNLDKALLDCALQNIHQRRLERRREAIHDALLLAGIVLSSSLATVGCVAWYLIVEGRL